MKKRKRTMRTTRMTTNLRMMRMMTIYCGYVSSSFFLVLMEEGETWFFREVAEAKPTLLTRKPSTQRTLKPCWRTSTCWPPPLICSWAGHSGLSLGRRLETKKNVQWSGPLFQTRAVFARDKSRNTEIFNHNKARMGRCCAGELASDMQTVTVKSTLYYWRKVILWKESRFA